MTINCPICGTFALRCAEDTAKGARCARTGEYLPDMRELTGWVEWMRARRALLRVGGTWGIPGPPPFTLTKTETGWKVGTGQPDSMTRLVCKAAGLTLEGSP